MNYDIVLVTRNRRAVLEISIPLMLAQSRLPQQFIVVDSSDDHPAVVRTVEAIFAKSTTKVPLLLIASKPGMTLQRNVGLGHVRSEIVMFPDDDALWYPEYASSIMNIYGRDSEEIIGGVPGEEARTPPPNTLTQRSLPYSVSYRDRIMLMLSRPLRQLERLRFLQEPAFLEGTAKSLGKKIPDWLVEANAQQVGPMTGFTMSFRTRSIAAQRFDESLGKYALFEDYDASLRVMDRQIIVKARNALVYHYRSPESRTNGFEWGMINILNRAYIICKNSPRGSSVRRNLRPFSVYKCMRYLAQCHTCYGRQRFKGAFHAMRKIKALLNCPPENLTQVYLDARAECLKHGSKPAA